MKTLNKKQYNKIFGNTPKKVYASTKEYLMIKEIINTLCEDMKLVEVESQSMTTALEYLRYTSEVTTISLPDGSHLRFKSRAKSIDITRVWVNPVNHRNGLGTFMMDLFMSSVAEYCKKTNDFPKIVLECSGQVGWGENFQETTISAQIKFFKNFGFEFVREDSHGYHHMELSEDGFCDWISKTSKKFEKVLVD